MAPELTIGSVLDVEASLVLVRGWGLQSWKKGPWVPLGSTEVSV